MQLYPQLAANEINETFTNPFFINWFKFCIEQISLVVKDILAFKLVNF